MATWLRLQVSRKGETLKELHIRFKNGNVEIYDAEYNRVVTSFSAEGADAGFLKSWIAEHLRDTVMMGAVVYKVLSKRCL